MPATEDDFLQELRATFAAEAEEHLQAIVAGLLRLERPAGQDSALETVETVFRAAHSLKGAARAVEMAAIESQAQVMEDLLAGLKGEGGQVSPGTLDKLHAASNGLAAALAVIAAQPAASPRRGPDPARVAAAADAATRASVEEAESSIHTVRISVAKLEGRLLQAEEMLGAKAAAGRQVAHLLDLVDQLQAWQRRSGSVDAHVRRLRHCSRSQRTAAQPIRAGTLEPLLDFFERNAESLRSLEEQLQRMAASAESDRQAVGKQVDEAVQGAKSLLLLPFASISGAWPKLVRNLCRSRGKEADLVIRGEEVELDKRILEEIKDAVVHLLRNSVDHGIEPAAQRLAAGKSARGAITIDVSQLGSGQVQVAVSDDGAGIDLAQVRASAVRQRLVAPEEAQQLADEEVRALVFRSEVSTSLRVTDVSGRGLGLAIVHERAQRLGGEVLVDTPPGGGTSFRIIVPTTRAAFRGIIVESAGQPMVVPTMETERVTRVASEAVRIVQGGQAMWHEGRAIPLVRMADVLQRSPVRTLLPEGGGFPAVIVNGAGRQAAFAVDAVLGEQEVLVKPLARPLSRVRNVAAATVLASGEIAMILDTGDLVRTALNLPAAGPVEAPAAKASRNILVVEDSITSRMLLKAILESAGYRVKTAVDGLEAYALLRSGTFDLVISDVEMPRLDGFGLTERIRADRVLSELPVVLVTSLEAREHRERGVDAGANAYVVKSNFDQSSLLEAVERLI